MGEGALMNRSKTKYMLSERVLLFSGVLMLVWLMKRVWKYISCSELPPLITLRVAGRCAVTQNLCPRYSTLMKTLMKLSIINHPGSPQGVPLQPTTARRGKLTWGTLSSLSGPPYIHFQAVQWSQFKIFRTNASCTLASFSDPGNITARVSCYCLPAQNSLFCKS